MSMTEDVRVFTEQIEEQLKILKDISTQILEYDEKRLERAVNIALPGMDFIKIWVSKKTVNRDDSEIAPVEYEYLMKDDVYLKGVLVNIKRGDDYAINELEEREDARELWLTTKGFISMHLTGVRSMAKWGNIEYKREIIEYDCDPLELDEDMQYLWDQDEILDLVISNLKGRAEDLMYRVTKQKERLERLKQLQII